MYHLYGHQLSLTLYHSCRYTAIRHAWGKCAALHYLLIGPIDLHRPIIANKLCRLSLFKICGQLCRPCLCWTLLLRSWGSKFHFHLLTNTFPSHDLFPPPFHHMTLSPNRLPIILTMWFSLAMHVTHTDSNLVACILGLTRESVRLGITRYFVRWLFTSTGTSSIRLESWQLPRCI